MKNTKGITLISLVITIIILLILAGISIQAITSDNGLFARAKQAKEETLINEGKEQIELAITDLIADKSAKGEELTKEDLEQIENDEINVGSTDSFPVEVIYKNYKYNIGENYKVTYVSEINTNIKVSYEIGSINEDKTLKILIKLTSNENIEQIKLPNNEDTIKCNNQEVGLDYNVIDGKAYEFIATVKGKEEKVIVKTKGITVNSSSNLNNVEDFKEFQRLVNLGCTLEGKTINLTNKELDLSDVCYRVDGTAANDVSWTPIGNETNKFEGTFNGKDNKILNLYINNNESNQGLFGYIGEQGKVQNLTIESGKLKSNSIQGAIASVNYGKIEKCTNNVNLTTIGATSCGGIVGHNYGIVYRCINNGDIISYGESAGGITAYNGSDGMTGFIIECINTGNITSSSWVSGGITACSGQNGTSSKGYVCNSYNTGSIAGGNNRRAGIVGQVRCRGGKSCTYNCYNRGNINGCPEIIGYDWGVGEPYISLNNYGATEATVEKLNVESDVDQVLKDTNLYRSNAWVMKDGKIALSWE